MDFLLKTLLVILLVYVGINLLLFIFQEKYIFFPTPISSLEQKKINETYSLEDVRVRTPDGVDLQGWLSKATDHPSKPLILYYGGNAESVWYNLEDLPKLGDVSLLLMNYRGYGDSGGKPSQDKLFADALQVYDQMVRDYGFDSEKIILMGRSMGSGVAVHVASQRKVAGLILVTPFDSLRNVGQKAYPIFPVKYLLRHPFDSVKHAPKMEVPVLALAGGQDSIVPLELTKNLLSQWKGPSELVVLRGAEHNDIQLYSPYWDAVQRFLSTHAAK